MCIKDVHAPCTCPHGLFFTAAAQFFVILSFAVSMLALTSCFYLSLQRIPQEGEPEVQPIGFGFMSRQVQPLEPPHYRQCVWYTSNDLDQDYFDTMWNVGKAFAMVAVIIGGLVMTSLMCTCCIAYRLHTFNILFCFCLLTMIIQLLSFLGWGSKLCDDEPEYECQWSSGSALHLTATILWAWAANMIKSFPAALPPRERGARWKRNSSVHSHSEDDDDDDDDDDDNDYDNDDNNDYEQYGDNSTRETEPEQASQRRRQQRGDDHDSDTRSDQRSRELKQTRRPSDRRNQLGEQQQQQQSPRRLSERRLQDSKQTPPRRLSDRRISDPKLQQQQQLPSRRLSERRTMVEPQRPRRNSERRIQDPERVAKPESERRRRSLEPKRTKRLSERSFRDIERERRPSQNEILLVD